MDSYVDERSADSLDDPPLAANRDLFNCTFLPHRTRQEGLGALYHLPYYHEIYHETTALYLLSKISPMGSLQHAQLKGTTQLANT